MSGAVRRLLDRASEGTMVRILSCLLGVLVPLLLIVRANAGDAPLPGGQFGYSPEEAFRALDAVGSDGRWWFTAFQVLDLALIPAYSLLLAGAIRRARLGWLGLCLVPLLAGAADYAENGCLLILLAAYPQTLTDVALAAGAATSAKWALLGGASLLALSGPLGVAFSRAATWLVEHTAGLIDPDCRARAWPRRMDPTEAAPGR
jgi:hypothetical protein